MLKIIFVYVLLFLSLGTGLAQAIDAKSLIGTWKLESYVILQDGAATPWCAHPYGLISYLANGYMAVGINCKDDRGNVVQDPKDMVFYTGSYFLKDAETVVHRVENSSELSRIGQELVRSARLKGDTVVLVGKGTKGLVRLTWKKIR